jgi:hypothetical protein
MTERSAQVKQAMKEWNEKYPTLRERAAAIRRGESPYDGIEPSAVERVGEALERYNDSRAKRDWRGQIRCPHCQMGNKTTRNSFTLNPAALLGRKTLKAAVCKRCGRDLEPQKEEKD